MDKATLLAWLQANWFVAGVVVLWLVANFAPRPHPDQMVGWRKAVWMLIDRACVLTAQDVPGKLKWIFAPSPSVPVVAPVVPPVATTDEKKEEQP